MNGTDLQYKFYKKIFKSFSKINQKKFLIRGKKILNDLTSGKTRYFYLNKSYFGKNNYYKKSGNNSSKIKIVIFAHDFVDSPHVYGNHFFSDFKKWFEFLNKIIKTTNYDWYIKEHPLSTDITKKEIRKLLVKNKKIKLINKNFPNNRLKKIGINYVLTVFGTVACELPHYGIKVINASKNNPHYNYKFCINPKNLNEYKKTLLNLDKKNLNFDLNELYFFHFMKELVTKNHLFFENPDKYLKYVDSKQIQFSNKIYEVWLNDFNLTKHYKIVNNVKKFISSTNYFFFKL